MKYNIRFTTTRKRDIKRVYDLWKTLTNIDGINVINHEWNQLKRGVPHKWELIGVTEEAYQIVKQRLGLN